ncbi:MAG: haloacid dehalogenase type II [Methyloligellaceae bacterium]
MAIEATPERTNMFRDIKACIFDAYGTLFDTHAPVSRIAAELGENADDISQLWRNKQLQYTWLRSLMKSHVDFWQITGDALHYALKTYNIEPEPFHDRLMQLYLNLDAYPDARETLTNLKGLGLQTGILSNGSKSMLTAAIGSAGLGQILDHTLSVDEVNVYKPDPRVYQMVPDQLHIRPEQVCFISSNAWDVAGAAHFGFQVAHINRFSQPPEQLPGTPKVILTTLSDLPPLLKTS